MSTTDVEIPLPFLGVMLGDLENKAVNYEEAGIDAAAQIMEQILAAESEEDLWVAQNAGTTAGKDFADRIFRMRPEHIEWRRSRQGYIEQGGFPFYFLARVTDESTGKEVVINCGGKTVCAVVWKLLNMGAFDKHPNGRLFMLKSNAASESTNEYLTLIPYADPAERGGRK